MFHVTPCSTEEALEIIMEIDNNKASEPKNIHLKILKTTKHFIATHLCQIFNLF